MYASAIKISWISKCLKHSSAYCQQPLFLLAATILIFFCVPPAQALEKHALLIGIADYSATPQLISLDGTINDIELTKQVLLQKHIGFQEEQIIMLKDKKATHSGIATAMQTLAAKVKKSRGGIVYIHYSGHGSQTRNLNKEENEDFDQTWVSYGARTEQSTGIDQWDILDDEIRQWLLTISDSADQVILVSDSCHSGSITRGEHPAKTRAAMPDKREHPLARKTFPGDIPEQGVFIGASRDTEQAGEYIPDDTSYGLFTWFWLQNLESAKPWETWQDLLHKTRIQVQGERAQQTPQISGILSEATVFAGTVTSQTQHLPISEVSKDGKTVSIEHGSISGATLGSIYTLYDPDADQAEVPRMQLTSCAPFSSTGTVIYGTFTRAADLVFEEHHAYTIEPTNLVIDGDFAKSGDTTVAALHASFTADPIPGYTLVKAGEPRTMTLYVTHPVPNQPASSFTKAHEILPVSDPAANPEVWILDSTNHLWQDDLKISYQNPVESWTVLRATLQKIARAKEIKRLTSAFPANLRVDVSTWRPDPSCTSGNSCLKDRQGIFRKENTFPFAKIEEQGLQEGDSLTFSVSNRGENDLYTYLLNIGPKDGIVVLFPRRGNSNAEDALLRANGQSSIDTRTIGRLVLSSGSETIKIIASRQPISVNHFSQKSYTRRGELKRAEQTTRGTKNPFNSLLTAAVGGKTRGEQIMTDPVSSSWGTLQRSVEVVPKENKR